MDTAIRIHCESRVRVEASKTIILDINKDGRRISLSVRRAQEAPSEASAAGQPASAGAVPAAPVKKKKRPELRGGLDFKY